MKEKELEFPVRVWEQTSAGKWASRKVRAADTRRRKRFQKSFPLDPDGAFGASSAIGNANRRSND